MRQRVFSRSIKIFVSFPLVSSFSHEIVVIFVVFERQIYTADDGLIDVDIFADERINKIVSFVQSNGIVYYLLKFEGVLILPATSSHEVNKLSDSSLVKYHIFTCLVLEKFIVIFPLILKLFNLLFC